MVFYHRFFAFKSYEEHDRFNIATTALFLASKVEETPRKLKDVVIEAYKTQHTGAKVPEPESRDLYERREKVLISERILLQTLGFDLSIEHPYRQVAWLLAVDSRGHSLVGGLAEAPTRRRFALLCCVQAAPWLCQVHHGDSRSCADCLEFHQRFPSDYRLPAGNSRSPLAAGSEHLRSARRGAAPPTSSVVSSFLRSTRLGT